MQSVTYTNEEEEQLLLRQNVPHAEEFHFGLVQAPLNAAPTWKVSFAVEGSVRMQSTFEKHVQPIWQQKVVYAVGSQG
jgi:hypothetical protein